MIKVFIKGLVALVQSIIKAEKQWSEFDRWVDRIIKEEKKVRIGEKEVKT